MSNGINIHSEVNIKITYGYLSNIKTIPAIMTRKSRYLILRVQPYLSLY